MRRLIEDAAFRRGIFLRQAQEADDVSLIKEMVRYGLGHAILPRSSVREETGRGSLSFLPIEHEALSTIHAIACRRDVALAPYVSEFRSLLRHVMLDLVLSGDWAGAVVVGPPMRPPPVTIADRALRRPSDSSADGSRHLRVG
jgi:DNA-binding transcriptional LysR family regulator